SQLVANLDTSLPLRLPDHRPVRPSAIRDRPRFTGESIDCRTASTYANSLAPVRSSAFYRVYHSSHQSPSCQIYKRVHPSRLAERWEQQVGPIWSLDAQ